MKRKIYCIPGFGTDERIFSNLSVNGELKTLHWFTPFQKESIQQYAQRMSAGIQEPDPFIIGVSFGGMMAIEIDKILPAKQLVLISSVKCRKEMPLQLRLMGHLGMNKIFPVKKITESKRIYEIANRRLGAVTAEEKKLANAYRRNVDLHYVNWSFHQILHWENKSYPANIVHIHGDKDRIFPLKSVQPTDVIKGGTHMMVYNRAGEISSVINRLLQATD